MAATEGLLLRLLDRLDVEHNIVIVDIANVALVDSASLAIFAWCIRRADEVGSYFALAGANPGVTRLLAMCGLDTAIPQFTDVAQATEMAAPR